jgi:DNA-binding NarL/FixJ family response regulator
MFWYGDCRFLSYVIQSGFRLAELRVMLVDESQARSSALVDLLQSVECEVVACLSPKEDLLSQVARYRPDVVIIDIDLPSRDTLENLRSVQASDPPGPWSCSARTTMARRFAGR